MLVWFRDVLLFKVTNDVNVLVLKEELSNITKHPNLLILSPFLNSPVQMPHINLPYNQESSPFPSNTSESQHQKRALDLT